MNDVQQAAPARNQGLDPRWVEQQQARQMAEDLAALRDAPAALHDMADAIREFPGKVVVQVGLIEKAYVTGFWSGISVTVVVAVVGMTLYRIVRGKA